MEMSLILAKLLFVFEMYLLDEDLDWESRCHVHVQWWKPELQVRFTEKSRDPEAEFS